MNLEEAMKVADEIDHYIVHANVATAMRVLRDAPRESQARVATMREDAARVADRAADLAERDRATSAASDMRFVATDIRALPAPGEVVAVSTISPASAPTAGPTPDDDVLTARFRAVHKRLDAVEMYLRPLGFAAGRKP